MRDVNVFNVVISKLIETENSLRIMNIYIDVIRPSVLILLKMSGDVTNFMDKNEDKNKDNKLMYLHINDDKLLKKYKTIWAKIEDSQNIELNALLVYDDRYIKTKIRAYGYKTYPTFRGLNEPEDGVEC